MLHDRWNNKLNEHNWTKWSWTGKAPLIHNRKLSFNGWSWYQYQLAYRTDTIYLGTSTCSYIHFGNIFKHEDFPLRGGREEEKKLRALKLHQYLGHIFFSIMITACQTLPTHPLWLSLSNTINYQSYSKCNLLLPFA